MRVYQNHPKVLLNHRLLGPTSRVSTEIYTGFCVPGTVLGAGVGPLPLHGRAHGDQVRWPPDGHSVGKGAGYHLHSRLKATIYLTPLGIYWAVRPNFAKPEASLGEKESPLFHSQESAQQALRIRDTKLHF